MSENKNREPFDEALEFESLFNLLPEGFGLFVVRTGPDRYGCHVNLRKPDGSGWHCIAGTGDNPCPTAGAAIAVAQVDFVAKAVAKAWAAPDPAPPAAATPLREVKRATWPSADFLEALGVIEGELACSFPFQGAAYGRVIMLWRLAAHYFHDVFREERDAELVAEIASCGARYASAIEVALKAAVAGEPPPEAPRGVVDPFWLREKIDTFLESFPEILAPKGHPPARNGKGDENSTEAQGSRVSDGVF